MAGNDEPQPRGTRRAAWAALQPNPVFALALLASLLLFSAIFIFGPLGKFPSAEVADILRTTAIAAIAAGVTTIVDRNISFKEFATQIESSLRQAVGVAPSLDTLGIRAAHEAPFDFGRIFREATPGETVEWLDTYCPLQNQFLDDAKNALDRGVRIRMLILTGGSRTANLRSKELESTCESGEDFEQGLALFESKMHRIMLASPEYFEIRRYSDLPGCPMYIVRDEAGRPRKAYFSLYLSQATGYSAHLELGAGEWLGNMAEYFSAKWAHQAAGVQSAPMPGPLLVQAKPPA